MGYKYTIGAGFCPSTVSPFAGFLSWGYPKLSKIRPCYIVLNPMVTWGSTSWRHHFAYPDHHISTQSSLDHFYWTPLLFWEYHYSWVIKVLTITLRQSTMAIHDLKAPYGSIYIILHHSVFDIFPNFPKKNGMMFSGSMDFHGFPWGIPTFFSFSMGQCGKAIHLGGASSKKPHWQLEPQLWRIWG